MSNGMRRPKTIRHRPVGQLADGQAEEIRHQCQLNMFFVRTERKRHGRERRQVEIDRQRTESAATRKNQNDCGSSSGIQEHHRQPDSLAAHGRLEHYDSSLTIKKVKPA